MRAWASPPPPPPIRPALPRCAAAHAYARAPPRVAVCPPPTFCSPTAAAPAADWERIATTVRCLDACGRSLLRALRALPHESAAAARAEVLGVAEQCYANRYALSDGGWARAAEDFGRWLYVLGDFRRAAAALGAQRGRRRSAEGCFLRGMALLRQWELGGGPAEGPKQGPLGAAAACGAKGALTGQAGLAGLWGAARAAWRGAVALLPSHRGAARWLAKTAGQR